MSIVIIASRESAGGTIASGLNAANANFYTDCQWQGAGLIDHGVMIERANSRLTIDIADISGGVYDCRVSSFI